MSGDKWPKHLCSYRFGDAQFSIVIPARDEQEARQRLRAIGTTGQVDGELVATIPANAVTLLPLSIFLPLIVSVRNFFFRLFR